MFDLELVREKFKEIHRSIELILERFKPGKRN